MDSNIQFERLLEKHEKFISYASELEDGNKIPSWIMKGLRNGALKLCLFIADFKCQWCLTEKELTIHHLVKRDTKEYLPLAKYLIARHRWSNAAILCGPCHNKADGHGSRRMGTFSPEKIQQIKNYFKVE